jgi:hypothetical protein
MRRASVRFGVLALLLVGCGGPYSEKLTLRSDLMSSSGAYRIGVDAVFRGEGSRSIWIVDCLGPLRGLRQSVIDGKSLVVIACESEAGALVSFVVDDALKETVDYCELRESLPAKAQLWWRDYAEIFASGDFMFCK